jgi:hypothetical protein
MFLGQLVFDASLPFEQPIECFVQLLRFDLFKLQFVGKRVLCCFWLQAGEVCEFGPRSDGRAAIRLASGRYQFMCTP